MSRLLATRRRNLVARTSPKKILIGKKVMEGLHNGPMDGEVPKVMGDGEGGAEYREESREDATVVGFIKGRTSNMEKNSNEEEEGPTKDTINSPIGLKGVNGPEQSGCDSRSSKQRDENGSAHKNVVNEPIVNNTSNCVKTKNVNALIGECVDINNCVDQFQPLNDNNIKEVSEKNNNTINCECVATEAKAKSDNQNERSRSNNRNKDAIKSHTRSKERSSDCGNKLKGKLSMCKIRELARSKLLRSQRSAMGIQNRKKDMKTCQGRSSKTSRGSKAKSKSSSCKIGAEELSQIEEFGQHIGFKWGGNKTRDSTVGEVGLGTDDKVDWIRELCYKEKPDVVGIQETKLRKLDFRTINKLWGSDEVDFMKLDVVGRSGVVDFNEVRRLDERLNSEFSKKGALAFNDFIRSEQLIDVPLGVALDRKLSDHCPIVLLDKGLDFGPKPFRFFDAWLKDVEMIDVVKEAWGAPVSTITPDCVFRDKLKNVKHALKEWSKKKYSGFEQEIDSSRKEAGRWEREAELRPLEIDEIEAWKRYQKNGFTGLMVDGRWNENPEDIKKTVLNYYQGVFKEANSNRPSFASGRFRRRNIISLMKLIKCFQMALGLKVNLNKSTLFGIGVEMEEVEEWATSLRCRPGALPFYYLGLPVGHNMGRIENWNILVQKFKNKLAIWKARFRFERDAFWVKVIKSLYGEGGGTVGQSLNGSGYSVWRNIIKVGNDLDKIGIHLSSSFEWEVGSGNAIMFWEDNWIGMGKLRDLFPRLYHLDVVNAAILGNKGFWRDDEWVWRSDLRGRAITDMHNLSNLVQDIQLKKDTKDKCKWRLNDGGSFTVKGLRDIVDSKILEASGIIFETSWAFEWIAARMKKDHLKWEDWISGLIVPSRSIEGHWDGSEFQDTTNSGEKKVAKAFTFYKMETKEASDRYIMPCFVSGLHAYDGDINLENEKIMILNEFAVKLLLDYEEKIVKKGLLVALNGELYFVIFIINSEQDDVEPSADAILENVDFGDIPQLDGINVSPYVCNMGKSLRNKKKPYGNYKMTYIEEGPSLIVKQLPTQEEIDQHKKLLDSVMLDKLKLDGEVEIDEDESTQKVIRSYKTIRAKNDLGVFVLPIHIEAKFDTHALADTGLNINVIPYHIYEK
ncbi:RNA-directed DNA polymerase, eukaryota, reverse transcriptase zinc-binding domain protein [Tanacetum coccineum]